MVQLDAIVRELATVMDKPAAEKLAQVLTSLYTDLHESMVLQRLTALERAVEQLTEAVQNLAASLQRLEEEFARYRAESEERFRRIEQALSELAEAQKRTEETVARLGERMDELALNQRAMQSEMLEVRRAIRELAEAQRKTEGYLQIVARKQEAVAKQWGGLSFSLDYTLENEAYRHLPSLLERDYGLVVEGRLKRELFEDATGLLEVNIYGTARQNGEHVVVVGESKVQLSRKDVEQFVRRKLPRLQKLFGKVFPVIVTHMTSQLGVKEYATSQGVAIYYSYDF